MSGEDAKLQKDFKLILDSEGVKPEVQGVLEGEGKLSMKTFAGCFRTAEILDKWFHKKCVESGAIALPDVDDWEFCAEIASLRAVHSRVLAELSVATAADTTQLGAKKESGDTIADGLESRRQTQCI